MVLRVSPRTGSEQLLVRISPQCPIKAKDQLAADLPANQCNNEEKGLPDKLVCDGFIVNNEVAVNCPSKKCYR